MGEGDAEFGDVDGLDSSVGEDIGETVAGVVAGAIKVS